jgi:hypothetical protein
MSTNNLNDQQFIDQIKAHPDFPKQLELHRAHWAEKASKQGWYKEPLHIAVTANKHGEILGSMTSPNWKGGDHDVIAPTRKRRDVNLPHTYDIDEKGICPQCDIHKKSFEAREGRPVGESEHYPGWDRDWDHRHF